MRPLVVTWCFGSFLVSLVAVTGCNTPVYIGEKRALATQPADPTMPMQMGLQPDKDLFVLPVRKPRGEEGKAVAAEQKKLGLMMPVPWAALRDFDIQIEWSIKNLDTTPTKAFLTVNGGSEFGDYIPELYIDPTANQGDQTIPPSLLGGSPIDLAAGETRTGIFREDEVAEAALDLEAIIRYPDLTNVIAAPFKVITRRSTASKVGYENVPPNDVIPAMVRFAFTLTSDGHVAADYSVRVRDHNAKLPSPALANPMTGYINLADSMPPPVMPGPAAP